MSDHVAGVNGEDAVIDPFRLSTYGFHKYIAEACVQRHATRWRPDVMVRETAEFAGCLVAERLDIPL